MAKTRNNLYLLKWIKVKELSPEEQEFIGMEWMTHPDSGTYHIETGDEESLAKMKREFATLYRAVKDGISKEDGYGADFAILRD